MCCLKSMKNNDKILHTYIIKKTILWKMIHTNTHISQLVQKENKEFLWKTSSNNENRNSNHNLQEIVKTLIYLVHLPFNKRMLFWQKSFYFTFWKIHLKLLTFRFNCYGINKGLKWKCFSLMEKRVYSFYINCMKYFTIGYFLWNFTTKRIGPTLKQYK